ncbi:hypothetical protein MHI43_09510 [Paenibacillus sp. FSL H8-0457]|uniref:hypothetical protein n=1 Tax=unclassified Paenibacillus TaxID=185978 RepID=UPI0003E1D9BC|nr:hypothetical protein [Paenibacillus sp. FSL H8-457]ETT57249.1 hypothetical protein C172_30148 [Paenibacillus sp. FSL H8-457]
MPVLRDCTDEGTRAEFHFISRIPGKYEGCQINFKFYDSNRFIYDLNFGWTNLTIRNYITVTTEFPLDTLNGFKLDGLYMSFEKHLYQLSWRRSQSEGIYELGFFGSDQDFWDAAKKKGLFDGNCPGDPLIREEAAIVFLRLEKNILQKLNK